MNCSSGSTHPHPGDWGGTGVLVLAGGGRVVLLSPPRLAVTRCLNNVYGLSGVDTGWTGQAVILPAVLYTLPASQLPPTPTAAHISHSCPHVLTSYPALQHSSYILINYLLFPLSGNRFLSKIKQ